MTYKVYLSSKVNPSKLAKGTGIIVIEPDDYTKTAVKAIKAKGYKVLAYLSIGTIEKERSWYKKYKKYALARLKDWPNENYADMRKAQWQKFLIKRATDLKKKGFDGWWLDNLDVYEYNKKLTGFYAACEKVLVSIKKLGGYVMVNGGCAFWLKAISLKKDLKKMVSGVTQEEVFSRIISYSGKGKFGKQHAEDRDIYQSELKRLKEKGIQTFMLEYTKDEAVIKQIKDYKTKAGLTGYYISKDVDL